MLIINMINVEEGETVRAVIPVKEFDNEHYLMLATKKGVIKKKFNSFAMIMQEPEKQLFTNSVIEELNLLHSEGVSMVEPTDVTASFKGRDSLYSHLDLMIKEAEESIVIMTTEQGIIRKIASLSKKCLP